MNTLKSTPRLARLAAVALLLGGASVGALAQYKIVGPDGKVTYTDKPPTASAIRLDKGAPSASGDAGLPYATRQAMGKYPVTLYSTQPCASCDSARQALRGRGVPFNEYSVTSDSDFSAYKARFGMTTFPAIVVGTNTLRGYSSADLAGYLDAAGYPAQARLTGYNWPPAVPMAPAAPTPAGSGQVAAAPSPAPSTPAAPAPLLPPTSKNGIQF